MCVYTYIYIYIIHVLYIYIYILYILYFYSHIHIYTLYTRGLIQRPILTNSARVRDGAAARKLCMPLRQSVIDSRPSLKNRKGREWVQGKLTMRCRPSSCLVHSVSLCIIFHNNNIFFLLLRI